MHNNMSTTIPYPAPQELIFNQVLERNSESLSKVWSTDSASLYSSWLVASRIEEVFLGMNTTEALAVEAELFSILTTFLQDLGFLILIVVFAWWFVIVTFIGVIPFLCDRIARRFPNHLAMFLILMTLTGLLSATFAIYVGVEYYACPLDQSGGSYGWFNHHSQASLLVFTILSHCLYSFWLTWRILGVVFANNRVSRILHLEAEIPNTLFYKLLIHGSSLGIPGIIVIIFIGIAASSDGYLNIDDLDGIISPGTSYYYVANPRGDGFYVVWIVFTILICAVIIMSVVILVQLVRTSVYLLQYQWRAVCLSVIFVVAYSFYLAYVYVNQDTCEVLFADQEEYVACLSQHPRDANPPCTLEGAPHYNFNMIGSALYFSPCWLYGVMVFLSYKRTWRFWKVLFAEGRVMKVLDRSKSSGSTAWYWS